MLGKYLSLIFDVTTLSPTSTVAFTINKGAEDGLSIDMNVIAGGGLVGRIIDIGPNWAKVNAIINDDSNVSGMVLASSDILMVSGSLQLMGEGVIEFGQLIDSQNTVEVGDKVVTSNISDIPPKLSD